ncbi:S1C family serine protease, partial [Erythrobacter cryptus]|uniref:S1C family serine protease n=1 Tax=Erythrobacter cryptus TaxID=196588 RepID=UPI00048403DB
MSCPCSLQSRRLWTIAIIAALLFGLWYLMPVLRERLAPPAASGAPDAQSRVVTARGDLAEDEKATIALFEKARDSVVFISTAELVADLWTRNVFEVPRGTGSGFIWDDAGHVVTNYHVIAGASQARVRLADGRDYKAALVGASPAHDIAVLKI